MTITILCVGKIKEAFYREAVQEYTKRLSRYASLQIIEVKDEPTPEDPSAAQRAKILEMEGNKLLEKVRQDDYVIALAIKGKKVTSPQLAALLSQRMNEGNSRLVFVIGGSLGLSEQVLSRAQYQLSFSDLTFPHQLMRVILLEQIYRSFRIMRGEPYHK